MLKISKKQKPPIPQEKLSVEEVARRASERFNIARAKKFAKADGRGKMSHALLTQVLAALMKETFPHYPAAFTKLDLIVFQKHLSLASSAGIPQKEYLEFVIGNWRQIVSQRFKGMKNAAPEYPSAKFLSACRETFFRAWADREEIKAMANMGVKERMVAQRTRAGMNPEAARESVEAPVPTENFETVSKIRKRQREQAEKEIEFRQKLMRGEPPRRQRRRIRPLDESPTIGEHTFGKWEE